MNSAIRHLFLYIAILCGVCLSSQAMADLSLDISANRERLYLGESLVLQVKVSGADHLPTPDLSAIKNCDITSLGSHRQTYSSTTFVNNQWQTTRFSGRIFQYNVTPRNTGRTSLGPISAGLGQSRVSAKGPSVYVTGVEKQDDVIVRVDASRNTVLVDESFEVTLNIFIKCLSAPYADQERLPTSRPPHLSVPYLTTSPIEGLDHTDTYSLLQDMITRRPSVPAVTINKFTLRNDPLDFESMFNFNEVNRAKPAQFSLPREKTEIDGTPYWHYHIKTLYVAREEGTHTFGPVLFKGGIIDRISNGAVITVHDVFAVGASQNVRIVPPPEEGRPASFIGAIGTNMTVDAMLDTQNCRVGDPLTLTLSVGGGVNLKNVYSPDLQKQEALNRLFRVYPDTLTSQRTDDAVRFSYTIRPTQAGTVELPPVELSYFDATARTYKTLATRPIPVTSLPADTVDPGMILGTSTGKLADADSSLTALEYVAPFVPSPSAPTPTDLSLGPVRIALFAGAPLLFLLSMAFHPVLRLHKGYSLTSRSKATYAQCLKLLQKAERSPSYEALVAALRIYISSRFGGRPDAITPNDISLAVKSSVLNTEEHAELEAISQRAFNDAFGGTDTLADDNAADDARNIMRIIKKLETNTDKGIHQPGHLLVLLCLSMLTASVYAGTAINSESEFLWHKAWNNTLHAQTPEEFAAVARDYEELAATGVRNKYVFYNLGTARLLAGDHKNAVAALERAERYGGSDSRIIQNIRAATEPAAGSDYSVGWTRTLFFWHYALPMSIRIDLALSGWIAFFVLLAFYRLTKRPVHKPLLAFAIFILVAFGSSALSSILEEHQARIRDSYITSVPDSEASQ